MVKQVSAGFIIKCPSGTLLCRATGTNYWDLPKGRVDEGENFFQAAVRELHEETGLTLLGDYVTDPLGRQVKVDTIVFLGEQPYNKEKRLAIYKLWLVDDIDVTALKCTSMVDKGSYQFPEVNAFQLATSFDGLAGKSMHNYLKQFW